MRWKSIFLIIVLSAILSHYNVQSNEDDRDYDENYDYSETKNEPKVSSEVETHDTETLVSVEPEPPAPEIESVISIAPNTTSLKAIPVGVRSGKYLDYPYMSALDLNEINYDWNGK